MADARLTPLAPILESADLDAVVVTPGPTFRRLFDIDFHSHERPLMVGLTRAGVAAALVPTIEQSRFDGLGFDGPIAYWSDQQGYEAAFRAFGEALGAPRAIGVEGMRLRFFEAEALRRGAPQTDLVDAQAAIAGIRLHKTPGEVSALERAIAVSEAALARTLDQVRIGMTEAEIESILIGRMFAEGAEALAFEPIVAAGGNSANSHAKARPDYAIQAGDALLFDFGAMVDGLCADLTRTVFVGHVSPEHRALYETVQEANAIGRAAARPGLLSGDLDDAVQTFLEGSAFAERIRHRTGHGLGREVHEEPYIMRGLTTPLAPGMVFTVEPGLYIAGEIGVRIEDDMLVTEDGARSLSSFPRDLRIVDPIDGGSSA